MASARPYGLFVLGSLAIPLSAPTVGLPAPLDAALLPAALPGVPRARCESRGTERRNRAVLILSSFFLGVAVVQWSVGQWVS